MKNSRLRQISVACTLALSALALPVFSSAQSGWIKTQSGVAGKDLNAIYFVDSKRGWVAGDGGFLSRTEDGGRTWTERTAVTDRAINDIYFANKESGFFLAGGSIFVTSDGGDTWREARHFSPDEFGGAAPELYSLRFSGKKKGWVVGSASRGDRVVQSIVAFTTDGGFNWQLKPVPTREELIHVDFVSDRRGWIVGGSGTILRTEDDGETWTRQQSGTTVTLYHTDFHDRDLGWAVGERGTVLRTEDAGQTWTAVVEVPVRSTLLGVQFVNKDDGWIVGRGGIIMRSSDGGRTWVQQESNTKQNLYALFMSKKYGWVAGGAGILLRYER
jgi:photosystem II stability/assembly factor-like uncharacterized protein